MSTGSSTTWWPPRSSGRAGSCGPPRTMTATCSPTPWRRGSARWAAGAGLRGDRRGRPDDQGPGTAHRPGRAVADHRRVHERPGPEPREDATGLTPTEAVSATGLAGTEQGPRGVHHAEWTAVARDYRAPALPMRYLSMATSVIRRRRRPYRRRRPWRFRAH